MSDLRTVVEVLLDRDPETGKSKLRSGDQAVLVEFVRELMGKADEAWKHAAEAPSDTDKNWWRSRAHTLCDALGDQEALQRLLDR